jgi:hypothetical protein
VNYEENAMNFNILHAKFLDLKQAENLDMKLSDKSKNRAMNEIIESHISFFNEESGNTREEGIKQLQKHLEEKKFFFRNECTKIKNTINEIEKEQEMRRAVAENVNTFLPIITLYNPIIFRIFLTVFSFCLYFELIDFNITYFILYIPNVAIPTIIISIVLSLWEYYRFYSKIRKYYNFGKRIYIFCKQKICYFYNKINY